MQRFFFFSSRRRHTRLQGDWSSDVCSSDLFATAGAHAQGREANCSALPTAEQLKQFLAAAPSHGGEAGGLFHGTRMWAAVVNRDGDPGAFATSTDDPSQVGPGSQAIAKAEA